MKNHRTSFISRHSLEKMVSFSYSDTESTLDSLAKRLTSNSYIVFLTGAGVSAESGVPTFRSVDGFWEKFKPEELAHFNSFIKNPALVQAWYQHRVEIVNNVKPNKGHMAMASMESKVATCVVITQNVDNLHQRAGSREVIELHGNILRNYCIDCGMQFDGGLCIENGETTLCKCGGLVRPDVVWFGEMLPANSFRMAEKHARKCDLFISVGTSGVVYPAAGLPGLAKSSGAFLVEINTEVTDLSSLMDVTFQGKSGEILPKLMSLLKS